MAAKPINRETASALLLRHFKKTDPIPTEQSSETNAATYITFSVAGDLRRHRRFWQPQNILFEIGQRQDVVRDGAGWRQDWRVSGHVLEGDGGVQRSSVVGVQKKSHV